MIALIRLPLVSTMFIMVLCYIIANHHFLVNFNTAMMVAQGGPRCEKKMINRAVDLMLNADASQMVRDAAQTRVSDIQKQLPPF